MLTLDQLHYRAIADHATEADKEAFFTAIGLGEPQAEDKAEAAPPMREIAPPPVKTTRKVARMQIMGHSATAVLRWMGKQGWGFEDAYLALSWEAPCPLADVTIRLQLKAGRDGERGPPAPITASQARTLKSWAK